ncbi:uncharacterized protein LOC133753512 isoform X4 [Lepus europaeus]|uniref:uncharacterized protein LOC133753512 isoform X4 n=1 Tax=Lepus europaeus TaxID=9983 RepID=UPI002B496705|nr:uncharacterized protein LOC133753512 isoform X4 [Lepus europaeus]
MGDFPSQCLFQVKDTGAGLDRKLDIAGAARRPHQESVFMPQQKQRSCGVSSPQEGDSAEPIPREDSGDFPSRHLILLKDTEAGLGRKQACLSQREDSGDSPNQHLIPLKNTEAGLAHPRERTLETSLTGISSRSKTQKLASSIPREDSGDFPNRHLILLKDTEAGLGNLINMAAIPGGPRSPQEHRSSPAGNSSHQCDSPPHREDRGGFPNRHLILFKDTGAGLAHSRERTVESSQVGVPSRSETQELGSWPGDLISMVTIPGGSRSPQEHRCSPAGTAVICDSPSWRKDSGDFPNWHLIPLKPHFNTQELAWVICSACLPHPRRTPVPAGAQMQSSGNSGHQCDSPSQREDSADF